jgi:uncharacterized protein YgbK (DUF1537 family)
MYYIIADDLTGATDTGVQFAAKGYNTSVIIFDDEKEIANLKDIEHEVIVLDSETREANPITAEQRIKKILKNIDIEEEDLLYKKVDSTLRGNIGRELDVIITELNIDYCIFSPSFPEGNRITSNGRLIVEDIPLGYSDYYEGKLDSEQASYITNILKEQTELNIELINIDVLENFDFNLVKIIHKLNIPKRSIIICDSIKNEDLKKIMLNSKEITGEKLFAGSAGLASYLTLYTKDKGIKSKKEILKSERILIAAASRRNIVDKQIEELKKNNNFLELKFDVEMLLKDYDYLIEKYLEYLKININDKKIVIIRPDPIFKEEEKVNKLIEENDITFRKLSIIIKNFTADLTKEILNIYNDFDLLITGGDTAAGICNKLKIEELHIINELLPGIPISRVESKEYGQFKIITKAGGFGDKYAFNQIVQKLI